MDAERVAAFFGGAPVLRVPGRAYPVRVIHAAAPVEDYVDAAVRRAARVLAAIAAAEAAAAADAEAVAAAGRGAPADRALSAPEGSGPTRPAGESLSALWGGLEDEIGAEGAAAAAAGSGGAGDILVFVAGQEDVEAGCYWLGERLALLRSAGVDVPPVDILPLYASLPAELQVRVFAPASVAEGKYRSRKIIFATNMAETSLTIDGVGYVIDSGFCKVTCFDPRQGMDALLRVPESQASARQRAGRAGRTAPGTCWRLFTERACELEMLAAAVPEIRRCNLGAALLLLAGLGIRDPARFDWLDPPPADAVAGCLYQLWALGALDASGGLTLAGRQMAEMPVDPPLARMLCVAADLGPAAATAAASVAAMLSVGGLQQTFRSADASTAAAPAPGNKGRGGARRGIMTSEAEEEAARAARDCLTVADSDHLTLLNVLDNWRCAGGGAGWCDRWSVQYRTLCKAREVRSQLIDLVAATVRPRRTPTSVDGAPSQNAPGRGVWHPGPRAGRYEDFVPDREGEGTTLEAVRRAICAGYVFNAAAHSPSDPAENAARLERVKRTQRREVTAARWDSRTAYRGLLTGTMAHLHPESGLYESALPQRYIVYHELVHTSRLFMRCVTAVQPAWLAEYAPRLYAWKGRVSTATM